MPVSKAKGSKASGPTSQPVNESQEMRDMAIQAAELLDEVQRSPASLQSSVSSFQRLLTQHRSAKPIALAFMHLLDRALVVFKQEPAVDNLFAFVSACCSESLNTISTVTEGAFNEMREDFVHRLLR